jgi:mannan endo-1,4-beta-mannosidase
MLSMGACLLIALMIGSMGGSLPKAAAADEQNDVLYEAELGELTDTNVSGLLPGFSGSGYVTGFEQFGDAVHFKVEVEEDGFYPLTIGYASVFGDKTNFVEVNGSTAGEQYFPQTSGFEEVSFGQIELEQGENRISLSSYWGYFDVDYIKIGPRELRTAVEPVEPRLVTPNPSREAQALMNYMTDRYGKGILSGQQRTSTVEADYIYFISGRLPVIAGFTASDFGQNAMDWADYGGIVSLEWHWLAPSGGNEFLTSKTSFDASRAITPGTEEYELLLRDLDEMAAKLIPFRDAGIPIIWRLLHEAEGGWFWWGAKGPDTAKQLYTLMFDRFTSYHKLNNLIWLWTTSDTLHSKEWYPGNDLVDMIGVDRYIKDGDYNPLMSVYDTLVRMVEGRKLVAYFENGPIPDPRQLRRNKVGWMYFNTWSGKFIMDGKINSEQHIRTVYNQPYVITLDEFPSELVYGKPPKPYPFPPRQLLKGTFGPVHE